MILFELDEFLRMALREDIGTGDITTESCIPADTQARGRFIAKEDGVVCGLNITERVFSLYDRETHFHAAAEEGAVVRKGDVIATVSGRAHSLLICERVALNLLQRLSGVATRTAEAVRAVEGMRARIVDTRKSTPGLRRLEKYAVRVGGGSNHRFNLSDGVLIKDNHIRAAGSIAAAVQAARRTAPHTLKVEVETETLQEVREALEAGADIIMLDNMDNAAMREAVELIAGRALVEASGGMGDRDLRSVAETGVDFISVGALTHSVKALDISLKFD